MMPEFPVPSWSGSGKEESIWQWSGELRRLLKKTACKVYIFACGNLKLVACKIRCISRGVYLMSIASYKIFYTWLLKPTACIKKWYGSRKFELMWSGEVSVPSPSGSDEAELSTEMSRSASLWSRVRQGRTPLGKGRASQGGGLRRPLAKYIFCMRLF